MAIGLGWSLAARPLAADDPGIPSRFSNAATSEQRQALADGTVTRSEYVRAMTQEVACLRRELPQAEITGPAWDSGDRFMTYQYRLTGPPDEESEAAEEACSQRHRALVESVWAEQMVPTRTERTSIGRALVDCLLDADHDQFASLGSVQAHDAAAMLETIGNRLAEGLASRAARDCMEQHAGYFEVSRRR